MDHFSKAFETTKINAKIRMLKFKDQHPQNHF